MREQHYQTQQTAWIEDLHDRVADFVAGRIVARHRRVILANIIDSFEFIQDNIHTRNRWWSNAKRLDELAAKLDRIPDAKPKGRNVDYAIGRLHLWHGREQWRVE